VASGRGEGRRRHEYSGEHSRDEGLASARDNSIDSITGSFKDDDPLRQYWLEGRAAASKRKNCKDMDPLRAEGFRAFQDGLLPSECQYGRGPRSQWIEGWEQAERAKERCEEVYS
jgi:hypothetical protein